MVIASKTMIAALLLLTLCDCTTTSDIAGRDQAEREQAEHDQAAAQQEHEEQVRNLIKLLKGEGYERTVD